MAESWALNDQYRLYIPSLTPESISYDTSNRNYSSFYLDGTRINADALPDSINWQTPYPIGVWYLQEDDKLHADSIPNKLSWTKPYPYSMWYIEPDFNHLFDSAIPYPPIIDAFRGCSKLKLIKIADSVQSIGKLSFEDTALTKVKLSDTCTYYSTTFPPDCVITGGQIIE